MGSPAAQNNHQHTGSASGMVGGVINISTATTIASSAIEQFGARCSTDKERRMEVETPFLLPMLFALQSTDLPLLPLAATLARASQGHWNTERNTFFVSNAAVKGVASGTEWYMRTANMLSLGCTTVHFVDCHIQRFHFAEAWPQVPLRWGSNFSPAT